MKKTIVITSIFPPTEAVRAFAQGLADENPDVDAIYRLTNDTPCYFDERAPVVLEAGTLCPFNSQNTATRRELFPLLYMPVFITFRFTDILRGLAAYEALRRAGIVVEKELPALEAWLSDIEKISIFLLNPNGVEAKP